MQNLWEQISSFIWVLLTGAVWGAYFDLVRAKRSLRRRTRWQTSIEDLLFWAGSLVLLAVGLILGNWMEIRVYVLFGLALGYLVYIGLMRPVVFPLFRKGFKLMGLVVYPLRRMHERAVFRRRLWWRRMKRRTAKQNRNVN